MIGGVDADEMGRSTLEGLYAVGEAGWPTKAEAGQVGVGQEEARDFNAGMIRVCSGGKGTPMMPGRRFETYVFSLFELLCLF